MPGISLRETIGSFGSVPHFIAGFWRYIDFQLFQVSWTQQIFGKSGELGWNMSFVRTGIRFMGKSRQFEKPSTLTVRFTPLTFFE
jgi:hypothetical protein